MNLNVGGAECETYDIDVTDLNVEVGAGDLEFSEQIAGNTDIKCGAGDVDLELTGRYTDYNYVTKCGAGDIEIGEKEFGGLANKKEIDNGASRTINIECGAGDVSIDFK